MYMINYIITIYRDKLKQNKLCKRKLKIVIYIFNKENFFTLRIINNYIILTKKYLNKKIFKLKKYMYMFLYIFVFTCFL